MDEIFDLVERGNVLSIRSNNSDKCTLLRNELHQTPLSFAILCSDGNNNNNNNNNNLQHDPDDLALETVDALLNIGAASSIFVQGYANNSLVCNLPMAEQPHSSSFCHPPPITCHPILLDKIDVALAEHINCLYKQNVEDQILKEKEQNQIDAQIEMEKKRKKELDST